MLFHIQDRLFERFPRSFNRDVSSILFLLFLAILLITGAKSACVSKISQWGFTLTGSAYASSPADNYPTCLSRCLTDNIRCKSLSYDLAAKTCELSTYSRWTRQLAFKPKTNSIYMEMIGVREVYSNGTAAGSDGGTFSPAAFCEGKPNGDYSHPTDCNKYITCSPADAISRVCGVGTNFHPVNKVCDFIANVVCP